MAIAEKGGIRIPILTYYSDKGVKAASKSLIGLETTANKLAKTFGVTLTAAATVAFGKKSLDAFAADQKAAAQLTATLYNLGLAYKGMNVNQFISDLQDATGVMDDQLRPALQSLATYTLDYAKAQDLLNTALNVSAATGKDLQSVSEALGLAYNGNYKGLVGLKIGITQAEAKAESFTQIMQQLNNQFKDAAFMDTYQTRLNKIRVATADAIEYIGQGIATALTSVIGTGEVEKTMQTIRNMGKVISEEIIGLAAGIKAIFDTISKMPIVRLILMGVGGVIKGLDKLLGISKAAKEDIANFDKKMAADQAKADAKAIAAAKQQAALNKKLQAQALADQKKINAEKAKQAALDKASLELKKAGSIFDLEQIELAAASMSKQTAEDYARIKLKQDLLALQAAIDAGDAATATKLAAIVEEDYKRVWAYQAQNIALGIQNGTIDNIKNAALLIPKDISLMNIDNLKTAFDYINQMLLQLSKVPTATAAKTTTTTTTTTLPNVPTITAVTGATTIGDIGGFRFKDEGNTGNVPTLPTNWGSTWDLGGLRMAENQGMAPVVNIQITDNAQRLVDVIMNTTQDQSANGTPVALYRNATNLAW